MDTGREASHWDLLWGARGRTVGCGEVREEMPDIGDGGDGGSKPPCHVCTYATVLHDLHMYPRTKSTTKKEN